MPLQHRTPLQDVRCPTCSRASKKKQHTIGFCACSRASADTGHSVLVLRARSDTQPVFVPGSANSRHRPWARARATPWPRQVVAASAPFAARSCSTTTSMGSLVAAAFALHYMRVVQGTLRKGRAVSLLHGRVTALQAARQWCENPAQGLPQLSTPSGGSNRGLSPLVWASIKTEAPTMLAESCNVSADGGKKKLCCEEKTKRGALLGHMLGTIPYTWRCPWTYSVLAD